MNTDDLLAIYEASLARDPVVGVHDAMWLDWHSLFRRESHDEWLVRDVWPMDRQVHVHAARKTGKSLVALWMACCIATGRDAFTGDAQPPLPVGYLDYEMTEDDLLERVEDMGFTADDLQGRLFYALHPMLPPMDTFEGGQAIVQRLSAANVRAVVIDTFSRVVAGDENSNDTYRAFYRHTGMALKQAGIAMMRLDHEGHLEGRSRGASAKADDVDVVLQLKRGDDGLTFNRMASRISWVPANVSVTQHEPLAFSRTSVIIPNGTMDKVAELDALNVPVDASRATIRKLFKDAGLAAGKNDVLMAAQRMRTNRVLGL